MGVPDRGPQITTVTLVFLSLSWIVVLARYYVRAFITKNFFIDDCFTGICLLLFTLYSAVGIAGVHWGVGRHVHDLALQNVKSSLKVWYICEIVYAVTAPILRISVALFLLRLVRRKSQRIIIYITSAAGIIYGAVYLAGIVYQCIPLSFFWERVDHPPTEGICFNGNVAVRLTIISTVVAAVMDWTFALLPIWMMWSLRISKQKKIMVCVLLGLGALASAAPLVRLPYVVALMNNQDFLWATTDFVIWSVVELGIGIIVISLPSCRPIFRSIPFFAAMSSSNSKNNPSKPPSHTKHSWPTQRPSQKGSFQLKDLESSIAGNSVGDVETFLSVSSATREVEDGIHKSSGY